MEIKINKNLMDYEEKYFGLTLRQILWGIVAIACSVATYLFLGSKTNIQALQIGVTFLVATPAACMGFFKYNGMNFPQFIKSFYRYSKAPHTNVYSSDNLLTKKYNPIEQTLESNKEVINANKNIERTQTE